MFACIYIPDFPVQASLLPESPEARTALIRSPIALLDGPANLPRVFATNLAARRAGIQIGMTKLQAEVCFGTVLRKRSLAEEDSAQSALLDCAAAFSPRVESSAPGAAIVDLSGTEKLFARGKDNPNVESQNDDRQSQSWPRALRAITHQAAKVGFDVRIALASNPDAAFLAARGFPQNTIIPIGDEARRLAPLSIKTLPLSPELHDLLNSWGILTFESLAALPEVAIVERLGQQGLHLQKLARGAVFRPLLTIEPNSDFIADFEFDDPVETLESIFFILRRLLHDICSRLVSVAQAASELRLTIGLNVRQIQREQIREKSGREQFEHVWKLPTPTQDKTLLFDLIRLHLEHTTFSAPVSHINIQVIPVKPRFSQRGLFTPPSPEPEKFELTLEHICEVVGSADSDGIACVGSPYIPDTHKPGSFLVQHFLVETGLAPSSVSSRSDNLRKSHNRGVSLPERSISIPFADRNAESKDPYSMQSAPTLRIFRPAIQTSVEVGEETPHFVRLWSRHRRVLAASGPWSTSGNWWNTSSWMREEWDVSLKMPSGPGLYRIYRDRLKDQWFVEGVFD